MTATRGELLSDNRELREENLKLHADLQKYESLQAENIRLRNLLDASYKVSDRVLIAELSAVDLDPYKQQVVINKGRSSGAYKGQAVLDADAVMGQVVQVTPFSSTVLLITDPSHSTPVQVLRSGLRTIAVGSGRINELSLPYLPTNSDIREGDLLVTSGLGGKFPPGYPVARVTDVNRSPDNAFAEISAEPAAHLDRSREVLLVWGIKPGIAPASQEASAAEPAATTESPDAAPATEAGNDTATGQRGRR
jgi:rod shape-determining protein MreC